MYKYKICCSGGKDSVASVVLWYIYHKDLISQTEVIFYEPMFDETISGLLDEQYTHIYNKVIPWCNLHGFKTTVLKSKHTYIEYFTHIVTRSKCAERNGKMAGGLISGLCSMTNDKQITLRGYNKTALDIVGIAYDEPKRYARLSEKQYSILWEHQITESMAKDICKSWDLLSPHYDKNSRDGCWFCPNQLRKGVDTQYHKELLRCLYNENKDKLITNKVCYGYTFDDLFQEVQHERIGI